MAKKQTRRTVSLNRGLYEIAKIHAERIGVPLSQFTENAIRVALVESTNETEASQIIDAAPPS